ncbi:hypothetical protein [Amycolatopsis sp.]|uniref:hypothetical protein n=1 Tax=Amycolatopsis sp. TaxID=37632 RepID=UPI002E095CA5|nr:hypothetical protein [Amycolatopsis sp.]
MISLRIKVVTLEIAPVIAVVACAAITGVAKPSVQAASSAQVISFPTSSAMRSRTVSRTAATTWPITITPVEMPSASEAAPASASVCSAASPR